MGENMARQRFIRTQTTVIALVAAWLSVVPALAQQRDGEGGLQADVGVYFDLNDNIFNSSDQEFESWIARISPDLLLRSAPGKRQFSLQYVGDYGKFFDSPDDDYQDHSLTGRGVLQLGSRGELDVSAVFTDDHDARGNGSTQGVPPDSPLFPDKPDNFERIDWTAEYTHGARGARGRLNFGLGESALEYGNNRIRTQFFDRKDSYAFVGLEIGARERTAFVMEARYTNTDYDVDRPDGSLNGDGWRGLVGFTWEATAKTEGSVRIGSQRRSFDDPVRESQKTASWDVAVRWSPLEYSYIDFVTARKNQETIGGGNIIDRSSYGVSWTHEWAIGLESVLSWDRREDDFVGTIRQQDVSDIYFGLRLPQGERVLWEAGVSNRDRNSTLPELVFDGMLYTIGVNFQLAR
jgi:hypothetical protein